MNTYKYLILLLSFGFLLSCAKPPTQFSKEALEDEFYTLDGNTTTLKNILDAYKGQTVVIDIWASWCKDCVKGLPKLKALQKQKKKPVYVFLSLDKNVDKWKQGIQRYNIKGDHYYMQSGWEGKFGKFLKLNWIPRYVVVNASGNIALYKSSSADDKDLINLLD